MIARVQRVLLTAPSREWEARLGEVGVACGTVNDVAGALVEPQTRARGLVVQNEHPAYGALRARARTAADPRHATTLRPAPLLGEHTTDGARSASATRAAPASRDAARRAASIA